MITIEINYKKYHYSGFDELQSLKDYDEITSINCGFMQLTSLPTLPRSLKMLYCYCNKLVSLPELPNALLVLECDWNMLSELPNLPNTLQILICNNNMLSSLVLEHESLQVLDCSNNYITNITSLPINLKEFYCHNSLSTLPNNILELVNLINIKISNNIELSCAQKEFIDKVHNYNL